MEYKSVSLKSVIGNVIRNTRLHDLSYINSMKEWIPEAMGMMKTRASLKLVYEDLNVKFHKAKLPCGLTDVIAVEYNGKRMHWYNGDRTYSGRTIQNCGTTVYVSSPKVVTKTISIPKFVWEVNYPESTSIAHLNRLYTLFSSHLLDIDVELNADLLPLLNKLNSLEIGTFTARWESTKLVIEAISDNTLGGIDGWVSTTSGNNNINLQPVVSVSEDSLREATLYHAQAIDIRSVLSLPYCEYTYYTELDWLNTSLCDGKIRLHYFSLLIDDEGFPLIPDNQNYKQAIYWYVRGMMIGAGFDDKVFKYEHCVASFELHAARALGEITYPSPDVTEAVDSSLTRLVFDEYAFDDFFENKPREPRIYE